MDMQDAKDIANREIEEKSVKTVGMRSDVLIETEKDDEYVNVGHVTFLDIENYEEGVMTLKADLQGYLDIYSIFKSSENNYHVISPVVRSMADILEIKRSMDIDDDAHEEVGIRKGGWTLRIAEKGSKPKPEYIDSHVNPTFNLKEQRVLSEPHTQHLIKRSDYAPLFNLLDETKTVGDRLEIRRYSTRENNHEIVADRQKTYKAIREQVKSCKRCSDDFKDLCIAHAGLIWDGQKSKPYEVTREAINGGE